MGIKSASEMFRCVKRAPRTEMCVSLLCDISKVTRDWRWGWGCGRGRWGGHVGECRKGARRMCVVETTRLVIVCSWRCRCSHGGQLSEEVGKRSKANFGNENTARRYAFYRPSKGRMRVRGSRSQTPKFSYYVNLGFLYVFFYPNYLKNVSY